MARITHNGLTVDVPDGWELPANDGPLGILAPDDAGAVLVSRFVKPIERRSQPTEESATTWAHRAAAKMTGGDVRLRGADGSGDETTAPAEARHGETWLVGESVCVWLDLAPPEQGELAGKHLAAGLREWKDAVALLTWIANVEDAALDEAVRTIFESIERAG